MNGNMNIEQNILISVIVPVYNSELYIKDCISSILQQTYKNIEVIVIDDGSTDNSYSICKKISDMDERVILHRQNNMGCTYARKKGVQISRGQYIGFVDSDDYILPDMYEKLLYLIIDNQVDIVCSGMITEGRKSAIEDKNILLEGIYHKDGLIEKIYPEMLSTKKENKFGILPHFWNKLFDRELIYYALINLDDHIIYGEDVACVYNCILQAKSIFLTNQAWYIYRIRENSICTAGNFKRWHSIQYLFSYLKEKFEQSNYSAALMEQLKRFIIKATIGELINTYQIESGRFYQCPFELIEKRDRIVIFGAGSVGQSYMKQLIACQYNVILWVDNKIRMINEAKISLPSELLTASFDLILIAVFDVKIAESIKRQLIGLGVKKEKIIWSKPNYIEDTYWMHC